MKVKLFGTDENISPLKQVIETSLEELGLTDFIELEQTLDDSLAQELNITQQPALIVEEESIDFKDMIFEGMVPDAEEIKSMFISIIGGGSGGGCGSKEDDGSCGTGCSC